MSGSEEDRTIADSRTESRFYRRKPGVGWLLALLVVPLLLALIGWGATTGRTGRDDVLAVPSVAPSATMTIPSAAPSTDAAAPPSAPADDRPFGPMSIVRSGNGFRLTGELPDTNMKTSLLDSIGQAMPGAKVVDELTVNPAVKGPEFSALGALFGTALDIDGFSSALVGDTLTLTGKAPSADVKAAAFASAGVAWPNVKIVNDIQVDAAGSSSSTPAPPPPAAAPAPAGVCSTLQADVTGLLRTPITFDTDGSTLAPASQRLVGQIADKLKACPAAKVAVIGYTDDTGGDRINVPLSASRAKAVADALVSDGVTRGGVTSQGAGSAKPIADNDTPAGRAQNRRVEITVS